MTFAFRSAHTGNKQTGFVIASLALCIFVASMIVTLGVAAHLSQQGGVQQRCLASAMGDMTFCE